MRAPSNGWIVWLTLPLLAITGCVAPTGPERLPDETGGTAALVAPATHDGEKPLVNTTPEHGC